MMLPTLALLVLYHLHFPIVFVNRLPACSAAVEPGSPCIWPYPNASTGPTDGSYLRRWWLFSEAGPRDVVTAEISIDLKTADAGQACETAPADLVPESGGVFETLDCTGP